MATGPLGPLQPGSLFAEDFRVIRPLGAGGMGAVYVVEQVSTGRQRALKLMLPELVSDPKLRARFEQEARIGSRIESERVVEVVAAGLDASTGTPFLAMELLRGEDLASLVRRSGRLSAPVALEIVAQLCHAVGAAHAAGIVHRDLKPDNVFVAETRRMGTVRTVKVLDFGIAKLLAEAKTAQTAAVGTPMWMAPEQTASGGAIGPQADVWAIGLIVFHVLTGRFFWRAAEEEGAKVVQLLREIVMDPIPPASQRAMSLGLPAETLPFGFDGWFARSLDRKPSARFANAAQQFEGLQGLLDPASSRLAVAPTAPAVDVAMGRSEPLPRRLRTTARVVLGLAVVAAAVLALTKMSLRRLTAGSVASSPGPPGPPVVASQVDPSDAEPPAPAATPPTTASGAPAGVPRSPSPREQLLAAVDTLTRGASNETMTVAQCLAAYRTYERTVHRVTPTGPDDAVRFAPANAWQAAPACFGKAGDCRQAWAVFQDGLMHDPLLPAATRALDERGKRNGFESIVPWCKGK